VYKRRCEIGPALIVTTYIVLTAARYLFASTTGFQGVQSDLCFECAEVGRAIASGVGFSNPFGIESGPTAWVAPMMPFVVAVLDTIRRDLKLDESFVYLSYYVLKIVAFLAACVGLLRLSLFNQSRWLAAISICLIFHSHERSYFGNTNDDGILLPLTALLVLCLDSSFKSPHHAISFLGLFLAICALSNPVLGLAAAICIVIQYVRQVQFVQVLIILLVAGFGVSPWLLRNYSVLGKWIPIKSNFGYELWQSQCFDDDGVLDATMSLVHPMDFMSAESDLYCRMGEIAYVEYKKQIAVTAIRTDPSEFCRRVWNRFVAACIAPSNEKHFLYWTLQSLVRVSAFGAAIWFLVLVSRRPGIYFTCAVGYLFYLAPYVLFSYYDRYSLPLMPLQLVLIVGLLKELLILLQNEAISCGNIPSVSKIEMH
jgi:hypothetical protein